MTIGRREACQKEPHRMRGRCGRTTFDPGAGMARLGRKSGVGMAVVFAVGAKGSPNQKLPPGPPHPPPSHCFPARYFPLLTAHFCPLLFGGGGGPEQVSAHLLGQPHAERRSPQLLSPSGLLPPRLTQHEPMFRKGNVLDCTNRGTFYIALTCHREQLGVTRPWQDQTTGCRRTPAVVGDRSGSDRRVHDRPGRRRASIASDVFRFLSSDASGAASLLARCGVRHSWLRRKVQCRGRLLSLSQGGALRRRSGGVIPVRAARPARARRSAGVPSPDGRRRLA